LIDIKNSVRKLISNTQLANSIRKLSVQCIVLLRHQTLHYITLHYITQTRTVKSCRGLVSRAQVANSTCKLKSQTQLANSKSPPPPTQLPISVSWPYGYIYIYIYIYISEVGGERALATPTGKSFRFVRTHARTHDARWIC